MRALWAAGIVVAAVLCELLAPSLLNLTALVVVALVGVTVAFVTKRRKGRSRSHNGGES